MVYIASFIKKLDPLLFHHILALTATNRGKISRSIQKVLHSQHIQNVLRSQRQSLQRVYREKIQTVEELQQCITEEWGRLTCVSSTTQRNSGVSASVLVSLQTADTDYAPGPPQATVIPHRQLLDPPCTSAPA